MGVVDGRGVSVKEEVLFCCRALAQSRLARQEPEVLVEAGDVCRRVPLSEIFFFDIDWETTVIYTTRGDLESRKGIQAWEDALVGGGFFRLHRSYLICLDHVAAITKTAVEMDSGIRLAIPRGKWEAVNRACLDRFRGRQASNPFPHI